jgi:hypothetical protein
LEIFLNRLAHTNSADEAFFGSLEAGANNALFYTLLANCRAQGLDPETYLIDVIKRLAHDATTEQAAALTPAASPGNIAPNAKAPEKPVMA